METPFVVHDMKGKMDKMGKMDVLYIGKALVVK
jgi:hypothetical protein